MRKFSPGDCIIYHEPKPKSPPDLSDENHFLTVRESRDKGTLVLVAPSGKMLVTFNDNPHLRRAHWWERLYYRDRFPRLEITRR